MPAERAPMRKIRDVLRLKFGQGVSERRIAVAVGMARSTIADCLGRARVAGIGWPIPEGIDDAELERRLFPAQSNASPSRLPPDWSRVHQELQRRSMTLQLLWEEYRGLEPEGYGYSQFCGLYGAWRQTVSATMRQTHGAGEKLFVDFAGDTVAVIDPTTGEVAQAHVFVAVLGASNYTYAEARWSEALPDWIGAHVNAFTAIGAMSETCLWHGRTPSSATTSRLASPPRAATSPASTAPTRISPPTMTRRSCRRVPTSPAIRPKSRSRC